MTELMPCPFCGGESFMEEVKSRVLNEAVVWSVGCNTEHCYGNMSFAVFNTQREAAQGWNTRVFLGAKIMSSDKSE